MKKILVIEDDVLLRRSLLKILHAEGFQLLEADNGQVGLQLLHSQQPDLVLCDLIMPEMDGYGVLEYLRSNPDTLSIPFICLTAQHERSNLRRVMELGADDYLTKPYSKSELLAAIQAQFNKQERVNLPLSLSESQGLIQLTANREDESQINLTAQLSLQSKFKQIIKEIDSPQQLVPVFILSLDRLERFQDYLGVDYGDILVQAVINRIHEELKRAGFVVKFKDEKIALILPPISHSEEIEEIALKLLNCLSKPIKISDYKLLLGCCLGVSLYPQHDDNFDNLLIKANIALRQAQQQGTHSYFVYTNEIWTKIQDRFRLEIDLHHALDNEEFIIHYQPQLDLKTGRIIGAEALFRWQHPQRGLVPPLECLSIAEENDLIVEIDEWMIRQVCQQVKQWQNQGFELSVAVNVSGVKFHQRNLGRYVMQVLKQTGLDPKYLELELTESVLVKNPERSVAILHELKNLGIGLSLDDFGTGYSSLSYLQKFPFDTLKLDRCFVQDVNRHIKNAAIVKATIVMAHSLNMRVVAEGVETEAEQQFLRDHECDCLQGYWFSRPVEPRIFEQLVKANAAEIPTKPLSPLEC
ncbi:Signaling protein YkoW [Planktothrix tepida]|uniref:Cyclic diguanylate phosphodiesterase (EAL) domain protein n=1 Tax=Planktothrix tepida PCC 9214 TaxID=671072 RepID=A0A1J1LL52_9CYAN|nr:EAL domain-containing response regulator [Planktothrix tepida]CAD5939605.1 Signaling protein YkoW [Planktothrix tepida]CUR33207.1 Cyclic diguanylate phosphodiesterase (EAL) domain protein [Planktothrix tepida PCC 9214]